MVGRADGREMFKSLVDVARPKIGRLEDVHVAVENFEAVVGHDYLRDLFKPFKRSNRSRRRTPTGGHALINRPK
jgi:hypothetical protein